MKFLGFILVYISTGTTNICNHSAMRTNTDEFNLAFSLFALRARTVQFGCGKGRAGIAAIKDAFYAVFDMRLCFCSRNFATLFANQWCDLAF